MGDSYRGRLQEGWAKDLNEGPGDSEWGGVVGQQLKR